MSKAKLKKEFLELLDKDIEFRYAIAGYLGYGELLKRLDRLEEEQRKLWENQNKLWEEAVRLREDMKTSFTRHDEELRKLREDMNRGFARHDEEFKKLWEQIAKFREDMVKGFERHDKEIMQLREDMNKLREDMVKGFMRHDEEFKRVWEELARLREDMNKGFARHDEELRRLREDMTEGFKRHDEELKRLREDMIEGFMRHDEEFRKVWLEIAKLREDMNKGFSVLQRLITALGSRWGVMAEEAFKEGLRAILEEELNAKVEKWTTYDEEGVVFGRPAVIDIDVAVQDDKVILIEVKSHIERPHIKEFMDKAKLYERKTKRKPSRLIMIAPFIEAEAAQLAKDLGIEVYTKT